MKEEAPTSPLPSVNSRRASTSLQLSLKLIEEETLSHDSNNNNIVNTLRNSQSVSDQAAGKEANPLVAPHLKPSPAQLVHKSPSKPQKLARSNSTASSKASTSSSSNGTNRTRSGSRLTLRGRVAERGGQGENSGTVGGAAERNPRVVPRVSVETQPRRVDSTVSDSQPPSVAVRRRLLSKSDDGSRDLLSPRPSEDRPSDVSQARRRSRSSPGPRGMRRESRCSPLPPPTPTSVRAWDYFEEHVRNIQDSSDLSLRTQGLSFQSSCTFQETMTHLFGHPDYTHPPPPTQPKAVNGTVNVAGVASRFLKLRKKSCAQLAPRRQAPDRCTVENARHGWRVLKQFVREEFLNKSASRAALSWSMLRQTLKGLSDWEKARLDLYRRYGVMPTVDSQGNIVRVNSMLSQKAQQAIASGSRHPLLVYSQSSASPQDADFPPAKTWPPGQRKSSVSFKGNSSVSSDINSAFPHTKSSSVSSSKNSYSISSTEASPRSASAWREQRKSCHGPVRVKNAWTSRRPHTTGGTA